MEMIEKLQSTQPLGHLLWANLSTLHFQYSTAREGIIPPLSAKLFENVPVASANDTPEICNSCAVALHSKLEKYIFQSNSFFKLLSELFNSSDVLLDFLESQTLLHKLRDLHCFDGLSDVQIIPGYTEFQHIVRNKSNLNQDPFEDPDALAILQSKRIGKYTRIANKVLSRLCVPQ